MTLILLGVPTLSIKIEWAKMAIYNLYMQKCLADSK